MKYFLAIIGGGPAGYVAAEKASKAGKDVVLFEQNALGGTCLNVGCIPTKSLLYGAKQYYNATHAQKYGVTANDVSFDFAAMQKRKTIVVRKLVAGIKQRLNNEHCTVVNGGAYPRPLPEGEGKGFIISCNETEYEAENLMICTGSTNFVPPIPGIKDNPAIWDSTDALAASELPESIVIVGGGVIGMEFATLYHELGVSVTVIEAMPTILPNLDQEVVQILLEKYKKAGINILTSTKVEEIRPLPTSPVGEEIGCQIKANGEWYEAERVLVSVGRRANLNGLESLEGLETERGAIKIDEYCRTNLPNVYACGDVTGKIMLAHVASRQAEVAVENMFSLPSGGAGGGSINYSAIPSVVYTNPEIASVGMTETQAEANAIPVEVRKLPMTFSGRFMAENEGETGLCKMIIDSRNNKIIGVHCIGNPCSEFIAAATCAVQNGYTPEDFKQVVFPHPTVSEILHELL